MTRVFVGGYADLAVAEFAGMLTGLRRVLPEGGAQSLRRPSYVVLSRDRSVLYAASETPEGSVVALAVPGGRVAGGQPSPGADSPLAAPAGEGRLARVRSGGADPCHLALSPDGGLLVVSNYSSGTVGLVSVRDGALTLQHTLQLTGHGPHPRQRASHAHQATWLSDTEVVVCDLGADSLVGLEVRAAGTGGSLAHVWSLALPPGTGPRHLVASPGRDRLWVVGELDNTVHVLRREQGAGGQGGGRDSSGGQDGGGRRGGGWVLAQTVHLLTPEEHSGEALAAGIVLDPSGAHLYVTVRGADVLVHLAIDPQGRLSEVSRRPTAHWPRFVGWLPGNHALVVAAERADRVQCFPVDADGVPGRAAWSAAWPQPTCLTR